MRSLTLGCIFATVLPAAAASTAATKAPEGCLKLKTDADWPSESEWKKAIPGVIKNTSPGPDYRITAKSVQDVQNAVKFAGKNKVRLSVIATGHDFCGRSTAASGLLVDVSAFKGIKVLESFKPTPQGAPGLGAADAHANIIAPKRGAQAAVTIGAGWGTQALNEALKASKLFSHGAAHGSVSVLGGWGQMGGHGPLTNRYGLGVDQWLEAKIVTADGELKVANDLVNQDLFWALRGGGGGTFGVVVEATIKVYPDLPITGHYFWINSTTANPQGLTVGPGDEGFNSALAYFASALPDLHARGISGYYYGSPTTLRGFTVHTGLQAGIARSNAVWKPILEKLQSYPGMTKFQSKAFEYKSFSEYYAKTYGTMEMENGEHMRKMRSKRHGPGETGAVNNRGMFPNDSRLLSAKMMKDPGLLKAMVPARRNVGFLMVAPMPGVANASKTSVNPGWRKAVASLTSAKMEPALPGIDSIRKYAPELGAYGNEAHYSEPEWQTSFWGSNYPKLAQLKTKFDPDLVFWVTPGINAEQMEVRDGRVCKAKDPSKGVHLPPATDYQPVADMRDPDAFLGKLELFGATFPKPGDLVGLQAT